MSLFTLALAAEFAEHGIAVNSLWPRTVIATAAVLYELGGEEMMSGARKPEKLRRARSGEFAARNSMWGKARTNCPASAPMRQIRRVEEEFVAFTRSEDKYPFWSRSKF
jgi:NAD(P)-dependent dehydrogenase (short-subunit alcohol dehydrogenase family)